MATPYTIRALRDTIIKKTPLPSTTLTPDQKIIFPSGQDLAALAVGPIDKKSGHFKVTFDFNALPSDTDSVAKAITASGLNTHWLYPPHIGVGGTEPNNMPMDQSPTIIGSPKDATSPLYYDFKLPGNRSIFNMAKPIVAGGRLFWYEMLHFDPETKSYRPPEDRSIVNNIVRLATFDRDVARPYLAKQFGCQPEKVGIILNSGYRDPATNKAVGGASISRHMNGDAADVVVTINGEKKNPPQINSIIDPLMAHGGLASASVFTHFDLRGYYARWSYGF